MYNMFLSRVFVLGTGSWLWLKQFFSVVINFLQRFVCKACLTTHQEINCLHHYLTSDHHVISRLLNWFLERSWKCDGWWINHLSLRYKHPNAEFCLAGLCRDLSAISAPDRLQNSISSRCFRLHPECQYTYVDGQLSFLFPYACGYNRIVDHVLAFYPRQFEDGYIDAAHYAPQ